MPLLFKQIDFRISLSWKWFIFLEIFRVVVCYRQCFGIPFHYRINGLLFSRTNINDVLSILRWVRKCLFIDHLNWWIDWWWKVFTCIVLKYTIVINTHLSRDDINSSIEPLLSEIISHEEWIRVNMRKLWWSLINIKVEIFNWMYSKITYHFR